MFEDPLILNDLEERFNRKKIDDSALEDILDGNIYKQYSEDPNLLGNPYNFSDTFNRDGCQSSGKSKVTIWPIYMMIHELPDNLRKRCMPLAGLWVAKQEPDMTIFLQQFVDKSNELSTKGFTWKYHTNYVTSKLFPEEI